MLPIPLGNRLQGLKMGRRQMSRLLGVLAACAVVQTAGAVDCFAGNDTLPLCFYDACSGDCTFDNGCLCADYITLCIPSPDLGCDIQPTDPATCCPPGLYWYPMDSCCSEELNCVPSCLANEICTSVNGVGVCLCNTTMYLHANRSDLTTAVMCNDLVAHIQFSKCLLERFHYDYTNWHYINDSIDCTGLDTPDTVNGEAVIFTEGLMQTGWCGNVVTTADGQVTFSNALYIPTVNSPIIYSNPLNLSYSCTYNLTMQTSLATILHPQVTTVNLPIGNGTGSADATMAIYLDSSYSVPYEADSIIPVGDPIYIGIFTAFADAARFALRAERCFASPTSDGLNPVNLINDGCAFNQDTNTQVQSNGVSLEVRFSVDTFVFENYPEVYMFCTVRLCEKLTDTTCTGCTSARSEPMTAQMVYGPVDFEGMYDSGAHTAVSWSVLLSLLLAMLSLRLM